MTNDNPYGLNDTGELNRRIVTEVNERWPTVTVGNLIADSHPMNDFFQSMGAPLLLALINPADHDERAVLFIRQDGTLRVVYGADYESDEELSAAANTEVTRYMADIAMSDDSVIVA